MLRCSRCSGPRPTQFQPAAGRRQLVPLSRGINSSVAIMAATSGQSAGEALAANVESDKTAAAAPQRPVDLSAQRAYW